MHRKALFIGGTKGLGLEMARCAINDGIRVTVLGRDADNCPLVLEERAFPIARAFPIVMDLAKEHPVTSLSKLTEFDVIVWVAGIYQQGSFIDLDPADIVQHCRVQLQSPVTLISFLLKWNKERQKPCHLITIGSTSAYKSRVDETLYDGLKAAKAQLTRALGKELPRDLPGSKVTLACPGGMATPNFWNGHNQDTSKFMDPADVARVIWNETRTQTKDFHEFRVMRQPDRSAKIEHGPGAIE